MDFGSVVGHPCFIDKNRELVLSYRMSVNARLYLWQANNNQLLGHVRCWYFAVCVYLLLSTKQVVVLIGSFCEFKAFKYSDIY